MNGIEATVNESIVVWSLVASSVGIGAWALVDVLRRSPSEFQVVGRSRTTWIASLVILAASSTVILVAFLVLLAAASLYLVRVKPQLGHRQSRPAK